jgi:hypothetical protein
MESTGVGNRINVSKETGNILTVLGKKGSWVKRREEVVFAKGKGKMQTYWLELGSDRATSGSGGSTADSSTNSSVVEIQSPQDQAKKGNSNLLVGKRQDTPTRQLER